MQNNIDNKGNNNINLQDVKDIKGNITITQHNYANPPTTSTYPKDLTRHVPIIDLNNVVGRKTDVAELHDLLAQNKPVVVVNGLGGIGKTTLAEAYLTHYYGSYQHVLWLTQSNTNDLQQDFVNAEGLINALHIATQGRELKDVFGEIIDKLRGIDQHPNLLVIDNVTHAIQTIKRVLPHPPQWHVLMTSRQTIEGCVNKELGFLSEQNALKLFQTLAPTIKDEAAIRDLLHIVDYHTLTIEILAKSANRHHYDINTLRTALEKDRQANIHTRHSQDEKVTAVLTYLCTIFDIKPLTEPEQWLMKQLACLPSVWHSYNDLVELINTPERTATIADTLGELTDKGWIQRHNDTYKMHRVIAEVTRKKLPISFTDVEKLLVAVTDKLNIDYTKDNPVDKFQWVVYGDAFLEKFLDEGHLQIATFYNNLGMVLKELGDYEESKRLFQKSLYFCEKKYGVNHIETIQKYNNLALSLQELGEHLQAKELLNKAISTFKLIFEYENNELANYYNNLAWVLKDLGEYENAKYLLKQAITIFEKNANPDYPILLRCYNNLAMVQFYLGELEEAKILCNKIIAIYESKFHINHPSTLRSYNNLAMILQDLGDLKQAKEYFIKTVEGYEKTFGKNHVSTGTLYNNFAWLLKDLGEYNDALDYASRAFHMFQEKLPKGHPSINKITNNYNSIKAAAEAAEKK